MEQYRYKNKKKLRCGYTTGTCAAGAAKAAAVMLLTQQEIKEVTILVPKGNQIRLAIEDIKITKYLVSCAVRKDAGDDADITNGAYVYAAVSYLPAGIVIDGGEGIGRVTREGLDQPVGMAAINRVPRQMIQYEAEQVLESSDYWGGLQIIISMPEGAKLAGRTFNPRLGIEGGLSILGTSGMVEPMSEKALVDTIFTEYRMSAAAGKEYLVVTPGNYGENFIEKQYNGRINADLKCSNFIGETIDMAYEFQTKGMLLIGHIGKLCKLSLGIMNTHSKSADGRIESFISCALSAGAENLLLKQISTCVTTDQVLFLLQEKGILQESMKIMMEKIDMHLVNRAYDGLLIGAVAFSNQYGLLGMTKDAGKLLESVSK